MKSILASLCLIASAHALPVVERLPVSGLSDEVNAWVSAGHGRSVAMVGTTGSMKPYLVGGEWVLLENCSGGAAVGDLVVIADWRDLGAVAHEVTEINPRSGWIKTQGLNNPLPDGWTHPRHIKARIVRVVLPVTAQPGAKFD